MKRLAVFGATGSIGASLLDIVRKNRGRYRIELLACRSSTEALIAQAREFDAPRLHVFDPAAADQLRGAAPAGCRITSGRDTVRTLIDDLPCDLVVNAIVGAAGLEVSYHTLHRGINLALANKESMVAGGELLRQTAARTGARILPIDSEHSALFQCLLAGRYPEVEKLILTASGGPFRNRPTETFGAITPAEALHHPNWSMGAKITIDSATLMNKGLEVIEAHFLFGVPPDRIEVVIHPQSIVHSMLQFVDGAVIAQLSPPDMRLPIGYALEYPDRLPTDLPRLDLSRPLELDFQPPDFVRFPTLAQAFKSLQTSGLAPLALNAANEVAVAAFLANQIKFTDIPIITANALAHLPRGSTLSLDDLLEADRSARREAENFIGTGTLTPSGR